MLRLENIKKDFSISKDQVTNVLKGITIQFRPCEFVSILGHSGCGKTTLLNIVGGLDKCSSGEVYLYGAGTKTFSDSDWNDFRNRQIGFVFQSYNLIPHQTVLKNVEMPLILAEIPEEERTRRALEALDKVGLRSQAKKRPMQMSGGQMQRVAIARAIVNNPSIILADEPTGALDSASGRQVMDILKEISKDKLVIMVTHNDALAEEYSTRIIKMNDGQIVDDSNEYSLEECLKNEEQNRLIWAEEDRLAKEKKEEKKKKKSSKKVNEKTAKKQSNKTGAVNKAVKTAQKGVQKLATSLRRKGNTHMSFGTAVRLSASNLYTKKGRSLLTSLAGSIGIIGIMLVLCLSNGVRGYINSIEENALSVYPMSISQTNSMDLSSMIGLMQTTSDKEKYPSDGIISQKVVLGNVLQAFVNSLSANDLKAFKEYIENNFDDKDGYVKYDYGVDFSVFCNYAQPDSGKYMQVDPFFEGMTSLFENNKLMSDAVENMFKSMGGMEAFSEMFSVWEQLPDNTQLLTSQYDLIGKNSRWPSAWNEVVIVVDEQNQVYDFSLFALGLAGENDVAEAILGKTFSEKQFTVDELLNIEYKLMTKSDYFVKVLDENGNWTGEWDTRAADTSGGYEYRRTTEYISTHAETVKVVGVIRPKQGVSITCMNGLIGYSSELYKHLSDKAKNSDIYTEQMQSDHVIINYNDANISSVNSKIKDGDLEKIGVYLGVADFSNPQKINIYASSFEGKDNIDAFIAEYNEQNGTNIKYTDMLGLITGYVDTLTETVTYVLIGFAAISLIVSSIMIAIIIYTSVLERRKEIGILRSIGARKKDISTIFISESGILGVVSGALGILIAYIFSLIANAILLAMLDIPDLATLAWWHPVMMIIISVLLSILAGFVPSRIASNKNPVECLRSE